MPQLLIDETRWAIEHVASLWGLDLKPVEESNVDIALVAHELDDAASGGAPFEIGVQLGVLAGGSLEDTSCTLQLRNRVEGGTSLTPCKQHQAPELIAMAAIRFFVSVEGAQQVAFLPLAEAAGELKNRLDQVVAASRQPQPKKKRAKQAQEALIAGLVRCANTTVRTEEELQSVAKEAFKLIGAAPAGGLVALTHGADGHVFKALTNLCSIFRTDRRVAAAFPLVQYIASSADEGTGSSDLAAERVRRVREKPEAEQQWDNALDVRIGRICRADVQLEFWLRLLYQAVAGGRLPLAVPGAVRTLVEDLRGMIDPQESRTKAPVKIANLLDEAEHAHKQRNRVVHDMWFRRSGRYPESYGVRYDLRSLTPDDPIGNPTLQSFNDLDEIKELLDAASGATAKALTLFSFIPSASP